MSEFTYRYCKVNGCITTWRNRIGRSAEAVVKDAIESDDELKYSPDKVSEFVTYLLGDGERKVPYIYARWGDGERKSVSLDFMLLHGPIVNSPIQGRFRNPLIVATYAYHVKSAIKPVLAMGRELSGPPTGALIHCVLAVRLLSVTDNSELLLTRFHLPCRCSVLCNSGELEPMSDRQVSKVTTQPITGGISMSWLPFLALVVRSYRRLRARI